RARRRSSRSGRFGLRILEGQSAVREARSGAVELASRAQRSTEWCAAEPGPSQIQRLKRPRISDASLRAASRPGHEQSQRRVVDRLVAIEFLLDLRQRILQAA